ncbi:unnamed protein product [Rhizoctonia solani]|uniref:Uncharacterized protein n=1 Tax=Rhizoctonia solani TaxID=456999 RepID=A0A8H3CHY8_9AGAM|nr:unnamed protein product [Rhizoctonia solani]
MSTALSYCVILPEILDIVCRYLTRGELACLARASRFFFHSAARELWSSWPVEDKDILNLLPDSLVVKPGEKITRFEVHIPAVLPPNYFERFNLYAPFVKHVTVSLAWGHNEEYIHQKHLPGWPMVACYARNHVLLPNLKKLDICERYSTTTSSRACADWLSALVPPSLSELDIFRNFVDDSPGCIERYLKLIDGILARTSANLERLRIHTIEPSINQLSAPSPNDPASETLMPGALISKALKHIVGMPRLRKLEIPELSLTLEVPDLPASSTCRLNSLQIACGAVEPLFHIWRTPIPAHLSHLSLSTNWPGTTSAVSELHELTTLIAAVSPHITKISFYFADIPDTDHLLDVLYPLHTLQLTELIVNGVQLTQPVQQISLRTIAEYWPLLEVLEIRHVGTSFNELVTVSSYLPRLTCLLMQLESTIPPELLIDDTAVQIDTRPAQELELVSDFRCVHTFNPTETNEFAKFLTKIWRSVNIKCYCRGYNHGPEYEEFKVVLAQHLNGTPPAITA